METFSYLKQNVYSDSDNISYTQTFSKPEYKNTKQIKKIIKQYTNDMYSTQITYYPWRMRDNEDISASENRVINSINGHIIEYTFREWVHSPKVTQDISRGFNNIL